ncbi:hypothetical protein ACVWYG_000606 [Pedobacter sp. UYEF25]
MRNLFIVFIFLSTPLFSFGQKDTTATEKKNTLTISSLVSSNANYYGQTANERLPFAYLDLKLKTTSGFYISGGGYQLLSENNFPSELHLSTGFEFDLGDHVDFAVGYTRSFYSKASPLLQASNPNNASATLGVDHFFRTELTGDYSFGQSKDVFISFDNAKNILLGQLGEKNSFFLKPTVSIVAGTQRFYNTYIEEQTLQSGLGSILPILGGNQAQTTETTKESTGFNLRSYNFILPFIYYRGKGALLLSYQLSVLSNKVAQGNRSNSFFSLGYFYQL